MNWIKQYQNMNSMQKYRFLKRFARVKRQVLGNGLVQLVLFAAITYGTLFLYEQL